MMHCRQAVAVCALPTCLHPVIRVPLTRSLIPCRSAWSIARDMYAQGGMSTFYAGVAPAALRVFLGAGVYFSLLDLLSGGGLRHGSTSAGGSGTPIGPLGNFAIAASARGTASILLSPVTVVKTRMEFARAGGSGELSETAAALRRVWAQGSKGMFAGLGPTILRDAPYSGAYFALYRAVTPWAAAALRPLWGGSTAAPTGAITFASAFTAGGLATLATQPFDMLRTRSQLEGCAGAEAAGGARGSHKNTLALFRHIIASEGFTTLYRGAALRVLKRSVASGITWTLVEGAALSHGGRRD